MCKVADVHENLNKQKKQSTLNQLLVFIFLLSDNLQSCVEKWELRKVKKL